MPRKPLSAARIKTNKVQHDIGVAEAKLHVNNQVLADTAVGTVATKASIKAAVSQNVEVEEKLHHAVDELAAVSALLKAAEVKAAGGDGASAAGHRSGEGVKSVMDHLVANRKKQ